MTAVATVAAFATLGTLSCASDPGRSVAVDDVPTPTDATTEAAPAQPDRTPVTDPAPATDPATPGPTGATVPAATQLPNIVLITTDDQRLDDMVWMPRTRRLLGAAGVTFDHAIAPHPLCCPARAEILTGQFAQNNGVRSNSGTYGGYHTLRPDHTIATWLTSAGYQTAFVGKHLNGYGPRHGRDPGWTIFNPTLDGLYDYFGFSQYNDGKVTHHSGYLTDYLARASERYIAGFHRSDSPFFLWTSYVAPHGARNPDCAGPHCWRPPRPALRHADLYLDAALPTAGKPSYQEADVSDKPPLVRAFPIDRYAHVVAEHRGRIASLASVDESVARTLDALRRTGELDNTYILFTSDNGFLLGEHRYLGKTLPYEEALAVPLLVRGPGVPAGQHTNQVATTVDLAATFVDIADASPTLTLDGQSLLPLWQHPATGKRVGDTVLIQAGPLDVFGERFGWAYRGVRTDRYTFVTWPRYAGFVELYDRRIDPYQVRNLANDPSYSAVRAELERRSRILTECAGARCNTRFGPVPAPGP